jgi:hypothetical protein
MESNTYRAGDEITLPPETRYVNEYFAEDRVTIKPRPIRVTQTFRDEVFWMSGSESCFTSLAELQRVGVPFPTMIGTDVSLPPRQHNDTASSCRCDHL